RLSETPEPGGPGSLLDNTLIVWTNELGKGNSHTLDNIPFVLVGGGLDFQMGRSLKYPRVPHNRLLLALAHGFGHRFKTFGNPDFCGAGPPGPRKGRPAMMTPRTAEPADAGPARRPAVAWEDPPCPLCGHDDARLVLEAPDSAPADGSGLWFAVVRCEHCGLAYTNPR